MKLSEHLLLLIFGQVLKFYKINSNEINQITSPSPHISDIMIYLTLVNFEMYILFIM